MQEPTRVDFSNNPMAEPDFKFYDKSLLDDVKRGDPNVHEFFRLLALCHTVMPEYKEGKYNLGGWLILYTSPFKKSGCRRCPMLTTLLGRYLVLTCIQYTYFQISKVWVAKVRAHTHSCDVRSHACEWNPFWKVCEMCVRAARFWACDVRSHFCTLVGTKRTGNDIFLSTQLF